MSNTLEKLIKDTVEKKHKDEFYREIKQMIKSVDAVMFGEKVTDNDILNAEIDDEITWEEKNEIRRQNISYKRHGFEKIKAIVKDYKNVFE